MPYDTRSRSRLPDIRPEITEVLGMNRGTSGTHRPVILSRPFQRSTFYFYTVCVCFVFAPAEPSLAGHGECDQYDAGLKCEQLDFCFEIRDCGISPIIECPFTMFGPGTEGNDFCWRSGSDNSYLGKGKHYNLKTALQGGISVLDVYMPFPPHLQLCRIIVNADKCTQTTSTNLLLNGTTSITVRAGQAVNATIATVAKQTLLGPPMQSSYDRLVQYLDFSIIDSAKGKSEVRLRLAHVQKYGVATTVATAYDHTAQIGSILRTSVHIERSQPTEPTEHPTKKKNGKENSSSVSLGLAIGVSIAGVLVIAILVTVILCWKCSATRRRLLIILHCQKAPDFQTPVEIDRPWEQVICGLFSVIVNTLSPHVGDIAQKAIDHELMGFQDWEDIRTRSCYNDRERMTDVIHKLKGPDAGREVYERFKQMLWPKYSRVHDMIVEREQKFVQEARQTAIAMEENRNALQTGAQA